MSDTGDARATDDLILAEQVALLRALILLVEAVPNWGTVEQREALGRLSAAIDDLGWLKVREAKSIAELVALRAVAGATAGLQYAWDALCRCVDEFEPEDMAACCERRDDLDTAILAVLAARQHAAPAPKGD